MFLHISDLHRISYLSLGTARDSTGHAVCGPSSSIYLSIILMYIMVTDRHWMYTRVSPDMFNSVSRVEYLGVWQNDNECPTWMRQELELESAGREACDAWRALICLYSEQKMCKGAKMTNLRKKRSHRSASIESHVWLCNSVNLLLGIPCTAIRESFAVHASTIDPIFSLQSILRI